MRELKIESHESYGDYLERVLFLARAFTQDVKGFVEDQSFVVGADDEIEDVRTLWSEAFKKSPSGIAVAQKKQAEAKAKRVENARVDGLVEREEIELLYPNAWEVARKNNQGCYNEAILDYASRWARLMQIEMREAGVTKLTKEIVLRTEETANNIGLKSQAYAVRVFLIAVWIHGVDFAFIKGFSANDVALAQEEAAKI